LVSLILLNHRSVVVGNLQEKKRALSEEPEVEEAEADEAEEEVGKKQKKDKKKKNKKSSE
jgi:hypothetical protein